ARWLSYPSRAFSSVLKSISASLLQMWLSRGVRRRAFLEGGDKDTNVPGIPVHDFGADRVPVRATQDPQERLGNEGVGAFVRRRLNRAPDRLLIVPPDKPPLADLKCDSP